MALLSNGVAKRSLWVLAFFCIKEHTLYRESIMFANSIRIHTVIYLALLVFTYHLKSFSLCLLSFVPHPCPTHLNKSVHQLRGLQS